MSFRFDIRKRLPGEAVLVPLFANRASAMKDAGARTLTGYLANKSL